MSELLGSDFRQARAQVCADLERRWSNEANAAVLPSVYFIGGQIRVDAVETMARSATGGVGSAAPTSALRVCQRWDAASEIAHQALGEEVGAVGGSSSRSCWIVPHGL